MTYKELRDKIDKMTDEQKNCDVTLFDSDIEEFFALDHLKFANENDCDVLDHGHPFLGA